MNDIKLYSKFYNDLTNLRIAISSIPFLGSQIDMYLSAPGQKFIEERLEYLIEQLQEELEGIEEYLINKEIIASEENFDLVQKAFIATAKTRQREKLKLFAKILKGSLIKRKKLYDPELYLKIVDELSVRELEIALLLYEVKVKREIKIEGGNEVEDGMTNDPYWFSKHYPKFSKDELEFTLLRLEKTGLVKELVGSFIGYGGGHYDPTSLFSDFINFIENNE
jgi:2-hydroxychromene-2-carboxylate isomerase